MPSARENGRSPQIWRTASRTNTLAIGPTLAPSARVHADRNVELAGSDAPASELGRVAPAAEPAPVVEPGPGTDQVSPVSTRSGAGAGSGSRAAMLDAGGATAPAAAERKGAQLN